MVARALRQDELSADDYLLDLIRRGRAARDAVRAAEATSDTLDAKVKAAIGDHVAVAGLATYRPNADSVKTDWRLVAAAYRKALEGSPLDNDAVFPGGLDTIESLFTQTVPGNRPLRYLKESFDEH